MVRVFRWGLVREKGRPLWGVGGWVDKRERSVATMRWIREKQAASQRAVPFQTESLGIEKSLTLRGIKVKGKSTYIRGQASK